MKLFWKLFCSMVLITALACSAGGYALIGSQFRASLDREVSSLYEENDLLRFALAQELAFNPLYSRWELAKAAGGAIEFTLAAPATVKVEFSSTGSSNTSSCGIVDAAGKAVKEDSGKTTVTGAQNGRTFFTYTDLAAGSYKIVSPADDNNRGARVYNITVE